MSRIHKTWTLSLLAVCGLFATQPAGVRADANVDGLLEQVPADAFGFVIIPSLTKLNDGANAMQTAIMGAPMFDVLSMASMQMGLDKGLDKKAGMIVFAMDMKKYEGKAVAGVVTTTDANAFLANFTSSDEDEDEDAPKAKDKDESKDKAGKHAPKADADGLIMCEINGEQVYAHVKGKYVTLTPNKELAKAIAASTKSMGTTVNASRKALFAERTITISVAAARVATVYQNEINNYVQMMAAMAGPQGGQLSSGMDEAMQNVRQIDTFDFSLQVDKAGVALTGLIAPKAGTEVEEAMKGLTASSGTLLKGLPGPDYVFTLGAKGNNKQDPKQVRKAVDKMLGNPAMKNKVDADKMKKIGDEVVKLQPLAGDVAMSISMLPEGPTGILALNLVIESTDSNKLLESLGRIIELARGLPSDEADRKKLEGIVTYKTAAETIGSTKVDHIVITPAKAGEDGAEMMDHVKKVLGTDGLTVRMGATDSQHLAICLGGGKEQFTALAKSAQSGDTSISTDTGVVKASGTMPKNRRMEAYLSVDSVMKVVNRIARSMGDDAPFPAGTKLIGVPVSAAASIDGTMGRFDLVIPMEVITGVKEAVSEGQRSAHRKTSKAHKNDGDDDSDHKDKKHKDDDGDGDDDDDGDNKPQE